MLVYALIETARSREESLSLVHYVSLEDPAGGAQANGAGAQAKSLICGMTRGDGVTKAFAQCPGCPGQPLYKSIRYKDTEVPCAACGNALPFTRFVVKDNKLVDNACKQCWK